MFLPTFISSNQPPNPITSFQPEDFFQAAAVVHAVHGLPGIPSEFVEAAQTIMVQTDLRNRNIPKATPVVDRPEVKIAAGSLDTSNGDSIVAALEFMKGLDASVPEKVSDISPEELADRQIAAIEARTNPVSFTKKQSKLAVLALRDYAHDDEQTEYARLTAKKTLELHGIRANKRPSLIRLLLLRL